MLKRCPSSLERWVDGEFKHATAGLVRGDSCQNPVTGSWFVFDVDPIDVQKEEALRAQLARWLFQAREPGDFPPLPVFSPERSCVMYDSPADWLVFHYALSWSSNGYDLGHPDFVTYAAGLRASGLIATSPRVADFIRDDVERMLKRFPPRPLAGLDECLVWHQQPRRSLITPRRIFARSHTAGARARPWRPKAYIIKPSSSLRPRHKTK
jgi:hypothetical protein